MKQKLYTLLWLLLCILPASRAQQHTPNSINLGIGGTGLLYTIGYERILAGSYALNAGGAAFLATENGTGKDLQLYTIPISASYLYCVAGNRHFIEAGLGLTTAVLSSTMNSYIRETDVYLLPTLTVGYRLHVRQWILKAAFTPFYGTRPLNDRRTRQQALTITGQRIQPWGGISLGYRF